MEEFLSANPISNEPNQIEGNNHEVTEELEPTLYVLGITLFFYQNFWCPSIFLQNIINFQQRFEPHDTDIILATKPKSGTAWLKALVYSIIHRTRFNEMDHPLLTKNPHKLVPFFEMDIYSENKKGSSDISTMSSPRLFATHIPYGSLPEPVKGSKCRVVYMGRNPYDTFVSSWKFMTSNNPEIQLEVNIEDYLSYFCRGMEIFGPHWEHVLGYWKESIERPKKFLFLKYEDMKENGIKEMKKLANFLGCEFTIEEEKDGVVERILKLCSLNNLKELEVNKKGKVHPYADNRTYFRKGEVGDWVNHLTSSMVEG